MNIASNMLKLETLRVALAAMQNAKSIIESTISAQKLVAALIGLGFLKGKDAPTAPIEDETPPAAVLAPLTTADTDYMPASPMIDRNVIAIPEKPAARQRANNAAVALLKEIEANELTRDDLSAEQIEVLATYTGSGGGLKADDDRVGSAFEYYTPKAVATELWDVAEAFGFKGGKVLDPSAGTGIFAAMSPENAVVVCIELDGISGGFAKVLNDGSRSNTIVSPFELQAKTMADNSLDMVITNVPFGDNKTRGANAMLDDSYQKEPLQNYFILRSLEKLKYGGLAIFIVPTSVVSGVEAVAKKMRHKASLKAELLGACRLPTSVFEQTGADVVTDVIIFRKFSREVSEKIDDLYAAGDIDTLTRANVLWPEYLNGKYFKQPENKKFILGELVEKTNRWGKVVETVQDHGGVGKKTTPEIAKIMRKFGKSRIDWEALDAAETEIIEYKNGDTVFQNGQQLQYQNGQWQVMAKEVTDTDRAMQDRLAVMGSALDMVIAGVTYAQVEDVISYSQKTNQNDLIPRKTQALISRTQTLAPALRASAWACVICSQAIQDAIEAHEYGFNFVTGEVKLTAFMKTAFLDGKNAKLSGDPKQDHNRIALFYAGGKYNAAWRGEVNTDITDSADTSSYQSHIGRLQYENKSLFLSREQLAQIDPAADPMKSNEWFINHDGSQVIAANDFLVGSLADRLADIDKQIEQATDSDIIDKLMRQKDFARENVSRIDLVNVQLDLRTPLIGAEDKVRFLKQSVHVDAFIGTTTNGDPIADIDVKDKKGTPKNQDLAKLYNRIGDWIKKGTISLGGVTLIATTQREALDWLTEEIKKANVKFNVWAKADKSVMDKLAEKTGNDANVFFTQNADETPIDIAGMNPALALHGYQNAFVRGQGRFFGGINGMGVGLGKTFSSLSSVQHVHNIGVKKKTIFVVPNSVLSNWRKEATFAYENTDDCIFIGLRENGEKFRVFSNKYDEDLLAAVDGKYRKIFMTFEAFKRMRLKEDTIADYTQYVKDTDSAYDDKLTHKDDERTKGMTADMIKLLTVNSNAPFLEDMKIDSVVIDEAHGFKNSVTAPTTDNGIRYLSQPKTSARGEDAQAKLWYIRSLTANKDGVQLLTATPITNSPLEIYSMMALASGRDTVNKLCGGIQGADDFIKIMCQIEEETLPTIDGGERSQNVFTGIRNAQILRSLVNSQAVIKDAQDVGMSVVIPDRELTATAVVLDPAAAQQLQEFQDAYTTAKELVKEYPNPALDNPDHPQSPSNPNSPISRVMAKYGEPIELIAAPFNLIRKMDVVIADAEFAERASFYDFEPAQEKIAQKVIDAFNAKAYIEKRKQLSPYTNPDDATEILVKEDKKMVLKGYKIQAMAKIILHSGRKRIVIDSLNGKTQANFETLADKAGLNLDVTISAKVAAMIENFKAEQSSPRGAADDGTASNIVKQIIFCDHLFLHNKIKKSLAKLAGVSASKIAIITGQINNEPDEMIDIQDGFNAHGDDNQYQVIIANEKAEVGINLQRGTQAIHHLTTGWTPDSLEQRNGRGARQGNKTQKVAIYHYDADGTFDEFKRTMIDKKDEWITGVLKGDGKNTIKVSGSITNTEKDALITAGGSKEAMREYQRTREANEIAAARTLAIKRQGINIEVMQEQTDLMAKISPASYYNQALIDIVSIIRENKALNTKNEKSDISKIALQKGLALFEQQKETAINALDDLISSVSIQEMQRDENYHYTPTGNVVKANKTAAQMYQSIFEDAKDYKPSEVKNWRTLFEKKELASGIKWDYKEAKVDDDSFYQASFDEARATAESLINQSVIAANFIADETGIDGISLPSDAGALIASRQATVVEGLFVTVGAFLYNVEADDVSELYVINKNLEAVRAYETGGKLKTNTDKIKHIYIGKKQAILPSDSRYLDFVKRVAALEDDWNERTLLTKNNAMYSDASPMVAEYRDGNVKPLWDIANTVDDQHAQLENCTAKYMLPLTMFGAGTAFASAAIDFYEKHNVTIDASAGKFSVDDESVNVIPRKLGINIGYYQVLYDDFIVEIVKATGAKVTKGDSYIFNRAMLMMKLVKYDHDNLMTGLDALMAKITADSDAGTFKRLAVKVYNDYVSDKEFTTGIEDDDIKIDILSLVYGKVKIGIFGNYDLIDRMNKRLTIVKDEAGKPEDKAQAEPVASNESPADQSQDIDDKTVVFIGGDTKTNKDTIKAYADSYGHVVSGGRKSRWYGRESVWGITYSAWRKMIEDKPSLATELTMRTNYN